jgi:deoxycytidine triphosphate deaminase
MASSETPVTVASTVTPFAGLLSDADILKAMEEHRVVIEPFNPKQLNNCSYDVTLGEHFYRHLDSSYFRLHSEHVLEKTLSNQFVCPTRGSTANSYWNHLEKAIPMSELVLSLDDDIKVEDIGIPADAKVICLKPGESILGHTQEFIGGRVDINTMLRAKSSSTRACLTICDDGGWGDVGFFGRYSMRLTNHSHQNMLLVVGDRIGQIVFMQTSKPINDYTVNGSYQKETELKRLMESWRAPAILPKIYK